MKTTLAALVGAACGAAGTFAYFKANPPGSEELATAETKLGEVRFDLDASKKAETRLREQVTELKRSRDEANAQLAAALESNNATAAAGGADANKPGAAGGNFSNVMEKFGKAQTDLAFKTLVETLGLEGEQLEAFTDLFEAMSTKRQEAFGKFLTGGLTLEELALIEGYTPELDDWVASNLDTDAQSAYSDYLDTQEVNRIERKANEELTWLTAMINLTPDQKDAAYGIFADHQGRERPQDFLQHTTLEGIDGAWQESMNSRYTALEDVLTPEQLDVYREQSAIMGEMFKGFIQGSLEGGEE
jgi:hypothetical protein